MRLIMRHFDSDYICAFVDGKIAKFGTVEEVMTKEALTEIYKVDFEIMKIAWETRYQSIINQVC